MPCPIRGLGELARSLGRRRALEHGEAIHVRIRARRCVCVYSKPTLQRTFKMTIRGRSKAIALLGVLFACNGVWAELDPSQLHGEGDEPEGSGPGIALDPLCQEKHESRAVDVLAELGACETDADCS